ncbi:hypothetical protein NKH74_27740 [Mesorhizobium sp. M0933]|uniref:hypothetical protein n=1 Tax=Mesorhizobium sp. M0933 TaxID=2957030 RepID=UPI003336B000
MAYEREPTLDEILNEPIIRKIMAVDGYSSDDIRYLMGQAGPRNPFVKVLKPTNNEVASQRLPYPATAAHSACYLPSA